MTVLLLCVGAAKAGTSWLYEQLSRHPQVHLRAIKELHFFDALEHGRLEQELAKHHAYQSAIKARVEKTGQATADQQRRLADRADWMAVLRRGEVTPYLDYLSHGAARDQVVADITPAYATLPVERLSAMAQMSPDVRVLYILRDPVDRLWSHVRMIAGRRDDAGHVTEARCGNILSRTLAGKETQISIRSDYAEALDKLKRAVPSPRLLIEVFEDMVAGKGLDRICAFLGIARPVADVTPVHAGQMIEMTPEQRMAAAAWLAPQYAASERVLGRLPPSWSTSWSDRYV